MTQVKRGLLLTISAFALSIFSTSTAIAATDASILSWIAENANSSEPAFLLLSSTDRIRVLLGTKNNCDSSPSRSQPETSVFAEGIRNAAQIISTGYSRTLALIGNYTSVLNDRPINVVLVLEGDSGCASSGNSTFEFYESEMKRTLSVENQALIIIGLEQVRFHPESIFPTINHETGHVLMDRLEIEETLLDEAIPDFLEMTSGNWDSRIGLGLGAELQAKIRQILADSSLAPESRRYQELRLSLSSAEALRDLTKAGSLEQMPKIDNPYIASVYINAFFWRLSHLVPRQSLEKAFFKSLLSKSRYKLIFEGSGQRFVTEVVLNLFELSPSLNRDKLVQNLLQKNGIKVRFKNKNVGTLE